MSYFLPFNRENNLFENPRTRQNPGQQGGAGGGNPNPRPDDQKDKEGEETEGAS